MFAVISIILSALFTALTTLYCNRPLLDYKVYERRDILSYFPVHVHMVIIQTVPVG